jgi:hypothetical protein
MTSSPRFAVGRRYLKQYCASVVSAALIYGGTNQIISNLRYLIANVLIKLFNAVIRKAFRDRLPLPEYGGFWDAHMATFIAIGVIVVITGLFIAVWANVRNSQNLDPKQSPRQSEG